MVIWDESRMLGYEDKEEQAAAEEAQQDEGKKEEYIEDDDDMRNARVRSTNPWKRRH